MLKIRLARGGAKKRPYYSIVVADSRAPRDGRFIEKVGAYNPLLNKDDPGRVTLKGEKIAGWLAKGAQPSDRVARFLAGQGLVKWQAGQNAKKGEPHAKAKQRAEERAEREAALAEARRQAEAEAAEAAATAAAEPEVAAEQPAAEEAPAGDTAEAAPEPQAESLATPPVGAEASAEG